MSNFFVERKSPAILLALATAPIFKKQGVVTARPAVVGEVIVTVLKDGSNETTNAAKEGDWVMTNPSGEQYLIPESKFKDRYEPTEIPDVYAAKGYCRAILNPFDKPIEIFASWGAPQTGDEHCFIADTCDAEGKTDGEPYLIDGLAFAITYKPA